MCVCVGGVTPSERDRKISFAVLGERSDSMHSSTGSLSQTDTAVDTKGEAAD